MKKINDHTSSYDENTNDNNPFSGITVHAAKIGLISEAVRPGIELQKSCFEETFAKNKGTHKRMPFHLIHLLF
jgi:hypothetical protein